MVNRSTDNNNNSPEDGDMIPTINSAAKGGGRDGGVTRSWGTTISGQSMSNSGSIGFPSTRNEVIVGTPASDRTSIQLDNLEIQGDEVGSQGPARKKKRGPRAIGGDKSGRGLCQFSMKVCEKVESKGRTTYNEVAYELVAEFAEPDNNVASLDKVYCWVYDVLNVLMAMDIISKDKEIQWKGLPRTSLSDIEVLKCERRELTSRIEKKAAYLEELEGQYASLQNLVRPNERQYGLGNTPSGGVALPFILVQTHPHATVEVEISEDMQLVHFDFNSTPFQLHDDNFVLKAMDFGDRVHPGDAAQNIPRDGVKGLSTSNAHQPHVPHPSG